MQPILEFFKTKGIVVLFILILIMFVRTCGMNSKFDKISKQNADLENKIDSMHRLNSTIYQKIINDKQMEELLEKKLFEFLLYEDDMDKGKTTPGQIRSRLDSNNK